MIGKCEMFSEDYKSCPEDSDILFNNESVMKDSDRNSLSLYTTPESEGNVTPKRQNSISEDLSSTSDSFQSVWLLTNIFQQTVSDCKVLAPLVTELLGAASDLRIQLMTTATSLDTFLNVAKKIAQQACNTKGSSRDLGELMLNILDWQKTIVDKIKGVASLLTESSDYSLKKKNEDFKKNVSKLDKEQKKEFRIMKNEIVKKNDVLRKITKTKKKDNSCQKERDNHTQQVTSLQDDLLVHKVLLNKQELHVLRRLALEERSQYFDVTAWLCPAAKYMLEDKQEDGKEMSDLLQKLTNLKDEPGDLPSTFEMVLKQGMEELQQNDIGNLKSEFSTSTYSLFNGGSGLNRSNSFSTCTLPNTKSRRRFSISSSSRELSTLNNFFLLEDSVNTNIKGRRLPRVTENARGPSTYSTITRSPSPFRILSTKSKDKALPINETDSNQTQNLLTAEKKQRPVAPPRISSIEDCKDKTFSLETSLAELGQTLDEWMVKEKDNPESSTDLNKVFCQEKSTEDKLTDGSSGYNSLEETTDNNLNEDAGNRDHTREIESRRNTYSSFQPLTNNKHIPPIAEYQVNISPCFQTPERQYVGEYTSVYLNRQFGNPKVDKAPQERKLTSERLHSSFHVENIASRIDSGSDYVDNYINKIHGNQMNFNTFSQFQSPRTKMVRAHSDLSNQSLASKNYGHLGGSPFFTHPAFQLFSHNDKNIVATGMEEHMRLLEQELCTPFNMGQQ